MTELFDLTDQDAGDEAAMNAVLNALAAEYPEHARADIVEMQGGVAVIAAAMATGVDYARQIHGVCGVAHNLKGQGQSFGYELLTRLGEIICVQLRDRTTLATDDLVRLRMIVDTCETVLDERLTGPGGSRGRELMARVGAVLPS